jgi:hypothetical protein
MSGLRAQLSPKEEVALRRVAFGSSQGLPQSHTQRLERLKLIEAVGVSWRLTPLGEKRVSALPKPVKLAKANASDEVARILAKFTRQKL